MTPSPYRAVITTTDKCPRCTARDPEGRPSFLGHEVIVHKFLVATIVFCYSSRCGNLDILTASTPDHTSALDLKRRWKRSRMALALAVLALLGTTYWALAATVALYQRVSS